MTLIAQKQIEGLGSCFLEHATPMQVTWPTDSNVVYLPPSDWIVTGRGQITAVEYAGVMGSWSERDRFAKERPASATQDDGTEEITLTIARGNITGACTVFYERREILTTPRVIDVYPVAYGSPVDEAHVKFETSNTWFSNPALNYHADYYHVLRTMPLPIGCGGADYRYILYRKRSKRSNKIIPNNQAGAFAPWKIYAANEHLLAIPQQVWKVGSKNSGGYKIGIINMTTGARSPMSQEVVLGSRAGYSVR